MTTTTYSATPPPAGPDVMTLKPGMMLGDMEIVAVAPARDHGIDKCQRCARPVRPDLVMVVVRFDDEEDLEGYHDGCAAAYRQSCSPIVVTVRADGTATVTGPVGTSVVVVTDFP